MLKIKNLYITAVLFISLTVLDDKSKLKHEILLKQILFKVKLKLESFSINTNSIKN